jgi:S1-C subfamily serine protease
MSCQTCNPREKVGDVGQQENVTVGVCPPAQCDFEKCDCYCGDELACLVRDAVVTITSEFILTTNVSTLTPNLLVPGTRMDVVLNGNGFFIKNHYIVCPAHLVLLPPSLMGTAVVRYPTFGTYLTTTLPGPAGTDSRMINQMVQASSILITVTNVNGSGKNFVYSGKLIGVDGAGDIAVLQIVNCCPTACTPCDIPPVIQECHPFLKFADSRRAKDGEKVFTIGDLMTTYINNNNQVDGYGAINEGVLSRHRHADTTGWVLSELLVVSTTVYSRNSGMPILNCQGRVIGMQTTTVGGVADGYVGAVSEFFMRRVIKELISSCKRRCASCHIESIWDPQISSYNRYVHGYLGIAYELMTAQSYNTSVNYTSGSPIAGLPIVTLGQVCKKVEGLLVQGVAGINPAATALVTNGYYFVPSISDAGNLPQPFPLDNGTQFATANALTLPQSPLKPFIFPGDVITEIGGLTLGDLGTQIPPSIITWRLCPGEKIDITWITAAGLATCTRRTICVTLAQYPKLIDYPWYAVQIFPLLANAPYIFIFPALLYTDPQYPQLTNDFAKFKPAI